MKSISDIVGAMTTTETGQEKSLTVVLPSRPCPLESVEIDKLEQAIGRFFVIKREPVYGCAPVFDANGDFIKSEYDVIGEEQSFTRSTTPPDQLRDALLRPAERRHTVFHLTRLAAHRRDTRGGDALAAVIEDIAMDLKGVSEWAVIIACRDFRQKTAIWYPTTGEIIESIRKNQRKIEAMFRTPEDTVKIGQAHQRAIEHDERLQTRWEDLPQIEWLAEHFDMAITQCETVLAGARKEPMGLSPEFWEGKIADLKTKKAALA